MAPRAKPPEAIQIRLKLFMFGPPGTRKTTAAIQFPKSYIIDGERGAENYGKLIANSGSVLFQTTDIDEVIAEVKALLTEKHDYRTLVIDPITPIYEDLLAKCEKKVGTEFGRHYGEANKSMKRLANLIMALDMNVIVTSHAKAEYGDGMKKIGFTFDGWKRLDYLFDLVIELRKVGSAELTERKAVVVKTRIDAFPDGDEFEWSYEAVKNRYGADIIEKHASTITLASPEQIQRIKGLLESVKLPEGLADKWLTKAGAESWEDMKAVDVTKCIDYIEKRLEPKAA